MLQGRPVGAPFVVWGTLMQDWQQMDAAALDAAYVNVDHIPGGAAYPDHWAEAAEEFRDAEPPERLSYGDHPRQTIDLFRPIAEPKGLVVIVHGGYWRRFAPDDFSHLAIGTLARGWAAALPGYVLAPEATIPEITAMVRRAVDTAAEAVPGPIRLAGHSAGGHVVARLAMPDAAPGCAERIEAVLPISPVADLRPLVPQTMNEDLRLTPETAAAESPALGASRPGARVSIHVGAAERPAFLWQAEALAKAWGAPLHRAEGKHHFDVIDALSDPESAMMDDLLG